MGSATIYLNGNWRAKEDLGETLEPGFLFGWGLFESMRVYQGRPCFLARHLERLSLGINLLGLTPVDVDWVGKIRCLIGENKLQDGYLRITVYRRRKDTGVMIYADKFIYYPPDTYRQGFSAVISPYCRQNSDIFTKIKPLSYLNNRLSWFYAQQQKAQEALVLGGDGFVAGGARSNLFIINGKEALTPALEDAAFAGLTRAIVIGILKEMKVNVREAKISQRDIISAREAFLTSSLLEVMPLVSLGEDKIGGGRPGFYTKEVRNAYCGRARNSEANS